jgi:hypothetical protein
MRRMRWLYKNSLHVKWTAEESKRLAWRTHVNPETRKTEKTRCKGCGVWLFVDEAGTCDDCGAKKLQ